MNRHPVYIYVDEFETNIIKEQSHHSGPYLSGLQNGDPYPLWHDNLPRESRHPIKEHLF